LIEAPATATSAPGANARPSPPFPARIVEIHARAGDAVQVGAPLFSVSMPEVLSAAATLSTTRLRSTLRAGRRSELEALRGEGLVDQGRIFEQDAELASLGAERAQALAVLRAASLSLGEAQASLRTGLVILRSPLSGIVREIDVAVGETRDPSGGPLASIVADVPARIEARFADQPPWPARFEFESIAGAVTPLADRPLAHVLDPEDGTYVLFFEPRDPVSMPAGTRGRVRAYVPLEGLFEVPASALLMSGGAAHVLVGTAERHDTREVEVLRIDSARVLVRGIRLGERVAAHPPREMGVEE
jgi:membrane fusion protein, heavy metal efflux system